MASRRRREQDDDSRGSVLPAQDDEADIIDEVGAERDEETGALMVDEEAIRKLGAADTASVIENRRTRTAVSRRRRGEKVQFSSNDLLSQFDVAASSWGSATFDITMRRLTGTPVMHTITSRPRSGTELYDAIKVLHGLYEEAEYEIIAKDRATKQFRVNGKITMPDTRPAPQQGQPMQYPPPGYPPQYQQPAPQPQQPQYQPTPQPTVQVVPPAMDPLAMMNQFFAFFQEMQRSLQPAPQPQPQVYQQPPQPVMMPPPPQTNDPSAQMAWMDQAMKLFREMQTALQHSAPQQQPQPQPQQQPQPQMMGPSRPAPPGMQWIWEPSFQSFVLTPMAQQEPPQRTGPMYRGRSPYAPQGDGQQHYQPPQHQQPPPPQQPKSIAEQVRESMGTFRTLSHAMQEIQAMMPGFDGASAVPVAAEDDDSPISTFEAGPVKLIVNKEDGKTRLFETGIANMPSIAKWLSEVREEIVKASEERRRREQPQQPPRQQLPPGYVEVGPDYRPPPGYVAVPADLPPPPTHVPPPIEAAPSPGRAAWGTSTIPGEGEG